MLSFIPLIALGVMVFAVFLDDQTVRSRLAETLVYYFPASGDIVAEAVDHLLRSPFAAGIVAVLAMVFGANGLFMAANRAVNRVCDVPARAFAGRTHIQLVIAPAIVILFLVSLSVNAGIQIAFARSRILLDVSGIFGDVFSFVSGLVSTLVLLLSTTLILAVAYHRLPNLRVRWSDAAFGAIIAVLIFEAAKYAFFWYTEFASQRNRIFGPLASVVLLLSWSYVAAFIFLYGAALTRHSFALRPPEAATDEAQL